MVHELNQIKSLLRYTNSKKGEGDPSPRPNAPEEKNEITKFTPVLSGRFGFIRLESGLLKSGLFGSSRVNSSQL